MSKYKVIPTIFHKKTKPCCICFENKQFHFVPTLPALMVLYALIVLKICHLNKNICQICRFLLTTSKNSPNSLYLKKNPLKMFPFIRKY